MALTLIFSYVKLYDCIGNDKIPIYDLFEISSAKKEQKKNNPKRVMMQPGAFSTAKGVNAKNGT